MASAAAHGLILAEQPRRQVEQAAKGCERITTASITAWQAG
jgi:hypothetical protein